MDRGGGETVAIEFRPGAEGCVGCAYGATHVCGVGVWVHSRTHQLGPQGFEFRYHCLTLSLSLCGIAFDI